MSAALELPDDQPRGGLHDSAVVGAPISGQASASTTPKWASPDRPSLPADHPSFDPQKANVGGDPSCSGHPEDDTHSPFTAAQRSPDPAIVVAAPNAASPGPVTSALEPTKLPLQPMACSSARAQSPVADHDALDTQRDHVGDGETTPPAPARRASQPNAETLTLADPLLTLAADVLDDLERVRIANENRFRQLTRNEEDSDGETRGCGLPADHPDVARFASLVAGLAAAEHQAELNLNRQMRKHPLGPWVKQARGVGEKQAARLLAAIGDPYINILHERPRTVSELWAYCGYHVLPAGQWTVAAQGAPASGAQAGGGSDQSRLGNQGLPVGTAASRARGQKANWSATAKKRGRLVAKSIVKQLVAPCARPDGQEWADHVDGCVCSPYRLVYDEARKKYAGTPHPVDCKQCGPSGKPAIAGSQRSLKHQEAMALRVVIKEVLKDLWREAKRLHEAADLPPKQK